MADALALILFVADDAPKSVAATANLRTALTDFAADAFALEIVNVYRDPDRALASRVLVTPTLLAPSVARRMVGDLSEKAQLAYFLQGLPVPLAS